jgi:hypothetical protein
MRLVRGRLQKLRALSWAERQLLVCALLAIWLARLCLWCWPMQKVRYALQGFELGHVRLQEPSAERVGWAIRVASGVVPSSTCLVQALAAEALLRLAGHDAVLTIGVARGECGLDAHAWIAAQGVIVLGDGKQLSRYVPIAAFAGLARSGALTGR